MWPDPCALTTGPWYFGSYLRCKPRSFSVKLPDIFIHDNSSCKIFLSLLIPHGSSCCCPVHQILELSTHPLGYRSPEAMDVPDTKSVESNTTDVESGKFFPGALLLAYRCLYTGLNWTRDQCSWTALGEQKFYGAQCCMYPCFWHMDPFAPACVGCIAAVNFF